MRVTRRAKPPSPSHTLSLTYRGLDWCDGCGAKLDAGDRLSGLCPECQDAVGMVPASKAKRIRHP